MRHHPNLIAQSNQVMQSRYKLNLKLLARPLTEARLLNLRRHVPALPSFQRSAAARSVEGTALQALTDTIWAIVLDECHDDGHAIGVVHWQEGIVGHFEHEVAHSGVVKTFEAAFFKFDELWDAGGRWWWWWRGGG